jgi:hypothetical protein
LTLDVRDLPRDAKIRPASLFQWHLGTIEACSWRQAETHLRRRLQTEKREALFEGLMLKLEAAGVEID